MSLKKSGFCMDKIQNLPKAFPVKKLSKFIFGSPEGADDPILDENLLEIGPISDFLGQNKSILVGDRGTGKTAVFRLLSEGKISFNNPEDLRQIYIPIDENLGFGSLKEHVGRHIKDESEKNITPYRLIWELYIFSRCLDALDSYFAGDQKYIEVKNEFYGAVGFKGRVKVGIIDVFKTAKKTFGVKLENGHLGYIVPNIYGSIDNGSSGDSSFEYLDLPRLKSNLGVLLASHRSVAYVMIDRLDEFVSGEDYLAQLDVLQALLHCWRDYQAHPKIKIKLFFRKDLYERLDFSAIGRDKIDSKKAELKWSNSDIIQLIAQRIYYNLSKNIKIKNLRIDINEETLKVDKEFIGKIRRLETEDNKRFGLVVGLKIKLLRYLSSLKNKNKDEYSARTVNVHEVVNQLVINLVFPRSVYHFNSAGKEESIDIFDFMPTHFSFANNSITPRAVLIFLEKVKDIAVIYYKNNPEEELHLNEQGGYPLFKREHITEAYRETRVLIFKTIVDLNKNWSRPAMHLMRAMSGSRNCESVSFSSALKIMGKMIKDRDDLVSFFAFYEHAGLFVCENRAQNYENRVYRIPVFFRKIDMTV